MIKKIKILSLLAFVLLIVLVSCNVAKNVPNGYHLVDKNNIIFGDDKLNEDEVALIIRQQPNRNSFGFRLRLMTYNMVDSTKIVKGRIRKYKKAEKKLKKKIARQERINARRIAKARAKGKTKYTQKIIVTDTIVHPGNTWREWLKYKRGEKPVIFDSLALKKSCEQLRAYIKTKGYYYGEVESSFVDNPKNPKKRTINYFINSGKPYFIDTVKIIADNPELKSEYERFVRKKGNDPILNEKFESDKLDELRYEVAKYMKDRSLYGFSPLNVSFEADTNKREMKLTLKVILSDRQIKIKSADGGDSVKYVRHVATYVNEVYFHIIDTNYFKGSFKDSLENLGRKFNENITLDTFKYEQILLTKSQKSERKLDVSQEILNPWRFATFYFNTKLAIRPDIMELQNYLEKDNVYKEYYIDRSYNRITQLDVFQSIKPEIIEIEGTNKIDVHYYLVTAKKQSFNLEPRFTNSNGFLGLAASVNYNNKNLFRGSEKLTISFSGGFESQPPVFDQSLDGSSPQSVGRSFNTFEIGPSIKLDLPGLLLVRRAAKLSKRHRPRTVLSTAYNFQKRDDFVRKVFQLNYLWKFYIEKTQIVQIGFPAAAIKFVQIDLSNQFAAKLDASNDLFLRNAYSNQFIWEDFALKYEYNNKFADNKKKINTVFNSSFSSAGFLLSKLASQDTTSTGQNKVLGIGFSRFVKVENDLILGYPINKKSSFHARLAGGFGVPLGENTRSLPFDYSFFSGGANDNRGWKARSLGPGSYKYYLDKGRTATQIGDVRLGMFGEYRYALSSTFKTALFADASNIWTYNYDDKRVGSQFSSKFYKELALTIGTGLRIDLSFFIIRLDIGFPLTNPAMLNGSKWIFQYWSNKEPYIAEGIAVFGNSSDPIEVQRAAALKELPRPFTPTLSFGIGFPF